MSPEETAKAKSLEANIVIMGGGGSGLAAAVAASEKGASGIIVLEKQKYIGGNSARAHGLFACESPVQKREMIDCRADDCFKILMNWAHWSRVDALVVRAYLNKSGDTIRWLEEKGLEFELRKVFPNQVPVWHNPAGLGAQLIRVLTKDCENMGVKLLLRTSGRKILRGTDGSVTGIVAVNEEGKEFEIRARSVIIATGGFGGNLDLLKKYCPDYFDGMRLEATSLTGDGLLMAAEAGAAIASAVPLLGGGRGPDISWGKMGSLGAIAGEFYTVWVNKKGKRFADESALVSGNAAMMQPEKVTFTLFDDMIRQYMEEKGVLIGHAPPKLEKAQRQGLPGLKDELKRKVEESDGHTVKISDSWDEIARWIGADPVVLKSTVDEYNSFCDRGHDEVLVKDQRYLMPLRKAPYYAIRCSPGFHDTMGGIKVNEHMEVRDTRDNIIPGLYTAGVLADGWETFDYCWVLCGSAFGFAINSGRIAGESAAKFVLGK